MGGGGGAEFSLRGGGGSWNPKNTKFCVFQNQLNQYFLLFHYEIRVRGGGGFPPPPADTTKTRSGPQRVRMSSGERPIGAANGKQSDAEALFQSPPPPLQETLSC